MNATTKISLILTAILLTAAGAFAQPFGDFNKGPGDRFFGPRMIEVLDLSEEQATTIQAMVVEHRDSQIGQRKEIMRLRNEKRGLMLQDDPDAGAVESLTRRMGELRTEQQVARNKMRLAIREQLTETQRDRMMMMGPRNGGGRGGRCFDQGEFGSRRAMGRGWDDDDFNGRQGRSGRQGRR